MKTQDKWTLGLVIGGMLAAGILLLFRLDAVALWDDEATTALYAQSVWENGDTDAMIGHNLVAYQSGVELRGMKNRVLPPLTFYLAAPFVGSAPGSAAAARFPFAMCGLFTVGMIMLWLWQARARWSTWVLWLGGLLTNVSFLLYSRQCRYYAVVILLAVVIAYGYSFRRRGWAFLVGTALAALLLLSANYLCYTAVLGCLLADYISWGRKEQPYTALQIVVFVLTQAVFGGLLLSVYNPLGVQIWNVPREPWAIEKLTLFFWNWRDLNSNELGVGVLILAAAVLGFGGRDQQARRAVTALAVYLAIVALFTPQPMNLLTVAFVRYLVPVIPLCVWIAVICVQRIAVYSRIGAVVVALLAFGTNVLHGGPLAGVDDKTVFSRVIAKGVFRSTIGQYIGALVNPPSSAYATTAAWINDEMTAGQSVWVVPGYATYPLMYHAPHVVYAWQLQERAPQFASLPRIHFFGEEQPDYIVAFGIYREQAETIMQDLATRGIIYNPVTIIDRYWYDLTRPELFWHAFDEITNFSRDTEAIYVYERRPL